MQIIKIGFLYAMLSIANLCCAAPIPYVLVSVAPYKTFVEKIGGGTIDVGLVVPAGASSHTFEPTIKQMLDASRAEIWFQIGESFEARAGATLKSYSKTLTFVDLRKGLDLIIASNDDSNHCHCCAHAADSCIDPHFWLSPKEVKKQAITIEKALSKKYPEHKELYEKNAAALIKELSLLETDVAATLAPLKNRTILVSHPAYAYFCRDFNLRQYSVEFEGKDPTPKQLTTILTIAKQEHIATIYIQKQYNSKGARLIAEEIGAKLISLDPYAEDYFVSMRHIARSFAKQ